MKQTISRYAGQCGCIFCHSLWAILSDCGQHATRLLVANDSARNRDYANMHNIILVLEDSMMAASPSLAHELCLPRMPASRSYFVTAGIHIIDSSASRCNAWDEVSSCTFAFRARRCWWACREYGIPLMAPVPPPPKSAVIAGMPEKALHPTNIRRTALALQYHAATMPPERRHKLTVCISAVVHYYMDYFYHTCLRQVSCAQAALRILHCCSAVLM